MKLNLLEAVEAAQRGWVAPYMTTTVISFDERPLSFTSADLRWRTEVRLGLEQVGPIEAKMEMIHHAQRMIAHEVYGEAKTEALGVLNELYKLGIRSTAINGRLERLITLLDGGDVEADPPPPIRSGT